MTIMTDIRSNWYPYFIKEFWRKPNRLLATKVAITMIVLSLPFVLIGMPYVGVTISLGVVASALSETDDHPRGRVKALFITILSFAITTFSVAYLTPYPIVFGIGFILSTIIFVLIGGISERYRAISYGAILIGIYAMLGYHENETWYWQPIYLCSGALAYGIVSLFLLYKKPWRLLEEQLASGFTALSEYLNEKALTFPKTENIQNNKLSILNIRVVNALEKCKEVINIYEEEVADSKLLTPYLQRFMLLQSLHERAASKHEDYETLMQKEEYAELFEGFAELLHQLSHATKLVAQSMLTGEKYHHPVSLGWIVNALEFEIEKLPKYDSQLLELLLHNLSRSHQSLSKLYQPENSTSLPKLGKDERTAWQRIKAQLSFSHPRLRYAIRLSACFLIGYLINQYYQMEKGEWIMLTSLLVSQSTYSETRSRLIQRILGTLTGVATGVFMLYLLPTHIGQWLLIISSSFFFFQWLRVKYSYAVIFITIFVLAGNELTFDAGLSILFPRILDTIIGALLSFLAIRFLWPNWQYKQIPKLLSEALKNNANYLAQIVIAKHINSDDDYTYRLARRLAHKSDNALTISWQSMQVEPKKHQKEMQHAFNLTYLNHVLLSYISALGALHEDKNYFKDSEQYDKNIAQTLLDAAEKINNQLQPNSRTLLKAMLLELKNKINDLPVSKERQHLRLVYNIGGVSNKILKETKKLN